jgi:hypothetical protein
VVAVITDWVGSSTVAIISAMIKSALFLGLLQQYLPRFLFLQL